MDLNVLPVNVTSVAFWLQHSVLLLHAPFQQYTFKAVHRERILKAIEIVGAKQCYCWTCTLREPFRLMNKNRSEGIRIRSRRVSRKELPGCRQEVQSRVLRNDSQIASSVKQSQQHGLSDWMRGIRETTETTALRSWPQQLQVENYVHN